MVSLLFGDLPCLKEGLLVCGRALKLLPPVGFALARGAFAWEFPLALPVVSYPAAGFACEKETFSGGWCCNSFAWPRGPIRPDDAKIMTSNGHVPCVVLQALCNHLFLAFPYRRLF